MKHVYRFADYEDAVWVTHDRKMDLIEVTVLLKESLARVEAEDEAVRLEGVGRFGEWAEEGYCDGEQAFDGSGNPVVCDLEAFQEWVTRRTSSWLNTVERVAVAAGFELLKPEFSIWFPDKPAKLLMKELNKVTT